MWAARRSAGGHVIRLPEVAVQTDHARSVQNHPATALDHARHHRARAGEHAFQVDADHDIELFVAHHAGQRAVLVLDELTIAQDAGVVDRGVSPAGPGPPLFPRAPDRGGGGDIHLLENAPACASPSFTSQSFTSHDATRQPSDRKSTRLNSSHLGISYAV